MSWSISIGPLAYPEILDAVADAIIPAVQGEDSPERQEQLLVAKQAARRLLVGAPLVNSRKVYVSLNGHHSQNEGWTPSWSAGASVNVVQELVPTPEEPKHEAEA